MYFFRNKGKQYVDFTGDLIITHNKKLIIAKGKSVAPAKALRGRYIMANGLTFKNKIKASLVAISFIWAKSDNVMLRPDIQND